MDDRKRNMTFIKERLLPLVDNELEGLGFKRKGYSFTKKIDDFFLTIFIDSGHPALKDKIKFFIKLCFPVIVYGLPSERRIRKTLDIPGFDIKNDMHDNKLDMTYSLFYYLDPKNAPKRYDSHNLDSIYNIIQEDIQIYLHPLINTVTDGKSALDLVNKQPLHMRGNSFTNSVLEYCYGDKALALVMFRKIREYCDGRCLEWNSLVQDEIDSNRFLSNEEISERLDRRKSKNKEYLLENKISIMAFCADNDILGVLEQWEDIN